MKRQHKKERKRAAIMQSATALFSERDYHIVHMDDVAARARVGKGTLYRYFPTKDDLYFATVIDAWDRMHHELVEAAEGSRPPAENLYRMTVRVLAFFWPRRQFVALLRDSMEHPEWRSRREVVVGLVESELRRADAARALAASDLRMAVELFLGMFRAALLYRGEESQPESLARQIVAIFLDGIRSFGASDSLPACEPARLVGDAIGAVSQEPSEE
ncbi:TetR/AcrR family transcriptional regulator [bacterium]|nr:TetR/AcrR family transcriptional regulator [bacterium]